MNERDAQQVMEDVKARHALWELLWKAAHDHKKGRPSPSHMPDEVVRKELQRILLPKTSKGTMVLVGFCRLTGVFFISSMTYAAFEGSPLPAWVVIPAVFISALALGYTE